MRRKEEGRESAWKKKKNIHSIYPSIYLWMYLRMQLGSKRGRAWAGGIQLAALAPWLVSPGLFIYSYSAPNSHLCSIYTYVPTL